MSKLSEEDKHELFNQLTERQREIVSELCKGDITNKEIAKKLGLEENSVKVYLNTIYSRLIIEGEGEEKRENLRREYCFLATGQVYMPSQPVHIPLEPENIPTTDSDIPTKSSVESSNVQQMYEEPPPARPRWIRILLVVGMIVVVVLLFVFRNAPDDPQVTEVAQVPTIEPTIEPSLEPTQEPTLIPTDTAIPTITPLPTNTPSPTQTPEFYLPGKTIKDDRVSLELEEYQFNHRHNSPLYKTAVYFRFAFRNSTNGPILLGFNLDNFKLTDDKGSEYDCVITEPFKYGLFEEMNRQIESGKGLLFNLICGHDMTLSSDVNVLEVDITNLSSLPAHKWKIEVPR